MNQEFDQILEDDCDFQIEAELYELRKKYMELKEQRKKSSTECQQTENRLKMLTLEEQKLNKREGNEKRLQEERDLMQSKLTQEKERVLAMKKASENDLELKKAQIGVMKENIRNVVTNWKSNLAEKNKSESQKLKMIREENEKFINLLKQEEEEKNKQQCIQIKGSIINSVDRRKKLEQDKKMKMKQMLEARISEELSLKNVYDDKINNMEEQEQVFHEKRRSSQAESNKGSVKNRSFKK
mmetsp:Transcript_20338/g.21126  ORF Transcript_20338/g.21126 Transcript_20338/m.21126 type:complete len:241 (+) Transcript_20338:39-761(+)|eukprot:CAMPEP_0170520270 /NCGR_PEP_ID=MMETSP0209-20121228/5519_1 /TAXON_ID=665100 ORGANISM="Litonotus pictus, Strain P1" /NCGR_SAMPLE_ID=MMETSP0209 /ASSEMBLY_ACC=CAM_ASM_000301 /LENGTH=240 /DNA_ID=CAMNT_0010806473 /DNA_START=8 /DNA_END=730 /DNA_ORIENTATION=+